MDRSGWAPLYHAGLGSIWMASFGTLFYWLAIDDSPLFYGAIVASVAYLAREMTQHEKRTEGPWRRGIRIWEWDRRNLLDLACPIVACALALLVVELF